MIKKILFGIIAILLFCVNVSASSGAKVLVSEEFIMKQGESLKTYNILLDRLDDRDILLTKSYGGSYIDDQGDLVIMMKDVTLNITKVRLALDDRRFKIKEARYSEEEVMEFISELKEFEMLNDFSFTSITHSVSDNKINVSYDLENEKYHSQLLSEFSSSVFHFIPEERIVEKEVIPLEAGMSIGTSINSDSFSLGFSATKGTTKGFITTGHHGKGVNDEIYDDGTEIGTIKDYTESGTAVDASWVELNETNAYLTNDTRTNKNIIGYESDYLPQNTYIIMIGKYNNSSGYFTGIDYGNSLNPGICEATYTSQSGDSGGVVLAPVGVDIYKVVGIHVASVTTAGTTIKWFSPYHEIANKFDIVAKIN